MASPTSKTAVAPDLATVADACLISSQRLIEWVGRAPTMEEDVALANIALDLLGQARGLLGRLGDEDDLAYFRDAADWHHPAVCELPNGDFAETILRRLFVDTWLSSVWPSLAGDDDPQVRGVAEKAIKENAYHLRHAKAWVVRLGDGTEESRRRMLGALDALWPYCAALALPGWQDSIGAVLTEATLVVPEPVALVTRDPAHLADLLTEMQSLARAHPGATW